MVRALLTSIALLGSLLVGQELSHSPAYADGEECWFAYAGCAQESSGDENWRSICYADFVGCIGTKQLSECPARGTVTTCESYLKACKALVPADPVLIQHCEEDADACALAHGC